MTELTTVISVQSNYVHNNSTSTSIYNASSNHFDFQLYQRALLRRNHTIAEGFRRMFNMTLKP